MEFKIEREPYEEGQKIFTKTKLVLEPNTISCFVGCNGSGKTTIINEIIDNLRKAKAKEVIADYYSNSMKKIFGKGNEENHDIFYINFDKYTKTTFSDMDYFLNDFALAYSSTGESIMKRFGDNMSVIGSLLRALHDKTVFIFFDDCDAGTSIDMIQDIKECFNYMIADCEKNNLTYYFILTANSFELCKDLDCISVHDLTHKHFSSYNTFKNFVLKSREKKDKREAK